MKVIVVKEMLIKTWGWSAHLREVTDKGISGVGVYGKTAAEAEQKLRERYECQGIGVVRKEEDGTYTTANITH